MKTYIKAVEIWEPDREMTTLSLAGGLYGRFKVFEEASRAMTFAYDDGLPGKAWAQGHPIVLTKLKASIFQRTEMARQIGLTAAIAMPIFIGEYLSAVVLFMCGDNEEHAGAIELWQAVPDRMYEMGLVEGYYGTMEEFAWISRRVKIMKGSGLPGLVWKTKMPVIMKDLGSSAGFLRARKAAHAGITTALALPAWVHEEAGYVMAFLSAKGTPIARRFEVWVPDESRSQLIFADGHCDMGTDLPERYEGFTIDRETSLSGRVWRTGRPALTETYDAGEGDVIFDALMVLPILQEGFLKAIVKFYF